LILLFSSEQTVAGRVLGWGPMVSVGLISYSAYLWHQPILSIARVYSKEPPATGVVAALLVMTFILAYITWRYVETPCRSREKLNRSTVFSGALAISILFASYGFYLDRNYGIVSRIYDSSLVQAADLDKRIYNQRVFQNKKDNFLAGENLKLLVVGNSFGRDFVNMTAETFDIEKVDIVYRDDFSQCILPFENPVADALYNASDVIVFASGDVMEPCLADNLDFARNRNKELFYIGGKSFGYNLNWIARLKATERANQWNRIASETLERDAHAAEIIPSAHYISLLKPVVRNGYIPITDTHGRLISIDRAHVTKYGAVFFGQTVLARSRYGEVLKRWGERRFPATAASN